MGCVNDTTDDLPRDTMNGSGEKPYAMVRPQQNITNSSNDDISKLEIPNYVNSLMIMTFNFFILASFDVYFFFFFLLSTCLCCSVA